MAIKFDMKSPEVKEFSKFIDSKKNMKGALMPVLQEAQTKFGYIPEPIVNMISKKLGILTSEIYGVATFYAQFTFVPKGKYSISVCLGTACYVKGSADILSAFEEKLNIKVGETTEDMMFSIVETRCVGQCSHAPVVVINDKVYLDFKPEDVDTVLEELVK